MANVTRFNVDFEECCLVGDIEGDLVRESDYRKLEEENAGLRSQLNAANLEKSMLLDKIRAFERRIGFKEGESKE